MSIPPLKILVAEDNEDDALLLQEAMGVSSRLKLVKVVNDGLETLAYLRREGKFKDASSPQLLLLDLNMPRKRGLEVLKELKSEPGLRGLPVVVLTSSQRYEDAQASYEEGACSFITKPNGLPGLVKMLQQFEAYWLDVAHLPD
ncbi:MAG TPA: response regulator [Vicinamibacteria bacterium]|nr:response regulator [Vicinamibacteria bacterium]